MPRWLETVPTFCHLMVLWYCKTRTEFTLNLYLVLLSENCSLLVHHCDKGLRIKPLWNGPIIHSFCQSTTQNVSYLCSSSCLPSLSKTFQILSIKDFLLLQIPLQTPCTLCGVMTSVCTPSRRHTQTHHNAADCASLTDVHLKVLVLWRGCSVEQVKEKGSSADAPVAARPSHLLRVTPEGKISVLSQSGPPRQRKKWATWQQRSLPFSWPSRVGSWCHPRCLQTTGRCPLWTGRSSPQLPSGPTYGKRVWLIPLVCPTVRTFLQCWLWMVSLVVLSEVFVRVSHFGPSDWTKKRTPAGFGWTNPAVNK